MLASLTSSGVVFTGNPRAVITSFGVVSAFLFSRPTTGRVARCGDAGDEVATPFMTAISSATSVTTAATVSTCSCRADRCS